MPRQTLASLSRDLLETKRLLAESKEAHAKDIKKIAQALNGEAEERDWCEDYQKFIADLNPMLAIPMQQPVRDVSVVVWTTVTIPVGYEVEVATDLPLDDGNPALLALALEAMKDHVEPYDLARHHRAESYQMSYFPTGTTPDGVIDTEDARITI